MKRRGHWAISTGRAFRGFRIYGGIDNLLNHYLPLGLAGTGTGGAGADCGTGNAAIFESLGRTFYLGAVAKF